MSKKWLLGGLALLVSLTSCTDTRSPQITSPEAEPTPAAPASPVLGTYEMEWGPRWHSRSHVTTIGYETLQLSTGPITTNDPCAREGSLRQLRPHQAFVYAYTRPDFFIGGRKLHRLHEQDVAHLRLKEETYGRFDVGGVTCASTYWLIVRVDDHQIMVFVAFGPDTTPKVKSETLQVLETLRLTQS